MLESNGLITIAFRRGYIKDGLGKPRNDMGQQEYHINEYFKSREWTQIIQNRFKLSGYYIIGKPQ